MRYLVLASMLTTAGWLAGCSSPTAISNTSPISITTSSPGLMHLEAGGLAIRGVGDTAVNFDLVSHVSVKNDSSVALHLVAIWRLRTTAIPLQLIKPSEFPDIANDTIDLGTVAPGSSIALDSIPIVTFSDSDLHGGQLVYILQFQFQNGPVLPLVEDDRLFSYTENYSVYIPFNQRYRGVIHTTESSPAPIDTLDGPDDGDWIGDSLFQPSPAYPNPALGATEVSFAIPGSFTNPESLDSVRWDLYVTPHHIVRSVSLAQPKSGTHTISFDLSGLAPGLYRLVWTAYKNGVVATSHGDIMVPLP